MTYLARRSIGEKHHATIGDEPAAIEYGREASMSAGHGGKQCETVTVHPFSRSPSRETHIVTNAAARSLGEAANLGP